MGYVWLITGEAALAVTIEVVVIGDESTTGAEGTAEVAIVEALVLVWVVMGSDGVSVRFLVGVGRSEDDAGADVADDDDNDDDEIRLQDADTC